MNLILFEPGEVGSSGDVSLTGDLAGHLLNVLHVSPGQAVRVGVLDDPSAREPCSRLVGGAD